MQNLSIQQAALGEWHPAVAEALDTVAVIHHARGRYAESEALRKRSIAIFEITRGKADRDVATSLNSLGGPLRHSRPLLRGRAAHPPSHFNLGENSRPRKSRRRLGPHELGTGPPWTRPLRRVRTAGPARSGIREKNLGPDHPDVAMSLKGLADRYYCQRQYDLAEPLYRRVLAIREKTLGRDHPFVATSLTDLGNLAYARGRYAECEPIFRQALAIEEKTLGSEHPRVACTFACLAYAYQGLGDLARAEAHYLRALAIREKFLPAVPRDVAGILENYAGFSVAPAAPLKQSQWKLVKNRSVPRRNKAIGQHRHPSW